MNLPTNPRVLIATKPVDFRKGMDGLAALVTAELKTEPFWDIVSYSVRSAPIASSCCSGTAPVCASLRSVSKAGNSAGRRSNGVMRLSPAQSQALLEGLDWSRVHAQRVARPTSSAVIHIGVHHDAGAGTGKSASLEA